MTKESVAAATAVDDARPVPVVELIIVDAMVALFASVASFVNDAIRTHWRLSRYLINLTRFNTVRIYMRRFQW